jgi:ABC-2 type transport system ATP-binding protein
MQQLIDPVIILDSGEIIFEHTVTAINESLGVRVVSAEPDADSVLYCEKVLGGYSLLVSGALNGSADVDLEILFNAVISNREKINAAFKGERT